MSMAGIDAADPSKVDGTFRISKTERLGITIECNEFS